MPFSEELISPLLGNGLHVCPVITNMLKYMCTIACTTKEKCIKQRGTKIYF